MTLTFAGIDPEFCWQHEELRELLEQLHPAPSAELLARIWWSSLVEPGDGVAGALISHLGPVAALNALLGGFSERCLVDCEVDPAKLLAAKDRWGPRLSLTRVTRILRSAASSMWVLSPEDRYWPEQLNDLQANAPVILWGRGAPSTLESTMFAVVGSRAATGYGQQVCNELVAGLVQSEYGIVSGGAYGIDRAAHRAALAVGGITVAVLAGGLDRLYPAGNETLFAQIQQHGCILSEVPPGTTPTKWRFLQRNRIIAALGAATVVVEAGSRSGARNTANHASELGRPLGAVPGPVTSAGSVGTHRLIADSLAVLVVDARACISLIRTDTDLELALEPRLRSDLVRIRDTLTRRSQGLEQIAASAGMSVAGAAGGLAELELLGQAIRRQEGWTRMAPGAAGH